LLEDDKRWVGFWRVARRNSGQSRHRDARSQLRSQLSSREVEGKRWTRRGREGGHRARPGRWRQDNDGKRFVSSSDERERAESEGCPTSEATGDTSQRQQRRWCQANQAAGRINQPWSSLACLSLVWSVGSVDLRRVDAQNAQTSARRPCSCCVALCCADGRNAEALRRETGPRGKRRLHRGQRDPSPPKQPCAKPVFAANTKNINTTPRLHRQLRQPPSTLSIGPAW
jgi:hypothetical protein